MRLATSFGPLVVSSVLALAGAVPCLAQSLEVREGAPVRIEIAHVDAAVEEGVARVEVDETFRNTTARVQEGVYRFKLPEDAVIGSFSMWMEGREKQGRVLEAKQARAVYESIVSAKRDPGLLEQTGWREFKVSVFPIPANDTVRIRLRYAHVVRDDLGIETLEIPLPQGAGAVGDLRVHATVDASRGVASVDCPSHANAVLKSDPNGAEATWTGDGVAPSGPFVLRAVPRRDGFAATMLAQRPAGAEDGWFVARVVPRLAAPPQIPRDVVFVVDRSGSMEGKKMDQARAALLYGLSTLKPGDRFDVISFSSDVTALGDGTLLDVTSENLALARRAANDLTASGGTNIADALTAALARRGSDLARLSAIVFLTDGDPTVGETNPEKILAAWRERAGAARLFAFGVGADVKDFLLTKLATEGRGDARYVREEENLEVKLAALFDRVRTPLLLDPVVEVEGDGVTVLDREPRRLPDLFQGRALVVSGRYRGAGKAVLHVRGRSGGSDVKLDVPVEFPAQTVERPHVAQIWAKARVERLLDDIRVLGPNAELRGEVLRLGLAHQLVTPYTSFLVVEDGVRLPPSGETAQGGPVNPDEAMIPDANPARRGEVADTGEFNADPEAPPNQPSGATGGTSIGVGGVGHYGTGKPSAFVSRSAGAGGRGGGGLGQGGGGGAGGSTKATETAVMYASNWLKDHQSPDGRWDSDGFSSACKLGPCDGAGRADGDVAATGLALLSFLGAGETHQSGSCRETVKNGLKFLRDIQDTEGCVGPRTSPDFLRQHAIAGLAMVEAYGMTGSRVFKEPAQRAIAFAMASRRPGGGWSRADGAEFDAETTGWMAMLMKSGILAGLDVDRQAIEDAAAEFDRITDPATGRAAGADAATAIATLVRIFAGRTPKDDPRILKGADVLAASLPKWDATGAGVDLVAWHFGSLAMFQVGGEPWRKWNEALKVAVIDRRRAEPGRDERGSWDPVGVGAAEGGRVWATALCALDMEVYYRYGRVVGVR